VRKTQSSRLTHQDSLISVVMCARLTNQNSLITLMSESCGHVRHESCRATGRVSTVSVCVHTHSHMYAYTHEYLKLHMYAWSLRSLCVYAYICTHVHIKISSFKHAARYCAVYMCQYIEPASQDSTTGRAVSVCVHTIRCTYVCVHMYTQISKASITLRAAVLCRANYGVSSSPSSVACDASHTLETKQNKLTITSKASPFSFRCIARIPHRSCPVR